MRSIDTAISLGPEIRQYLDGVGARRGTNTLLAGSIFSAAVFFGSALIYLAGRIEGVIGMGLSLAIMGVFVRYRRR